jgi:hypothetical protein
MAMHLPISSFIGGRSHYVPMQRAVPVVISSQEA